MRRFYIEEIKATDKTCIISGSEARHITKVLRMKPGHRFILMDGNGSRFRALIETASSREVLVLLESPIPKPAPSPVTITLCQALLKSRAMDYLIQKTSELGVDLICPFFSERTVARFEKARLSNKMRHWREIAINSAKQSDKGEPVKIETPCFFNMLMAKYQGAHALKVILWEDERSNNLKTLLRSPSSSNAFVGIVGAEGGFSTEEICAARDAGFITASLGDRVLRAETAAITLSALVQYELGDLNLTESKKP